MNALNPTDLLDIRGGSLTPTDWLHVLVTPTDPFLSLLFATWPDPAAAIGQLHERAES